MNVAVESNTVKYDSVPAFHPLLIFHPASDPLPSKSINDLESNLVIKFSFKTSRRKNAPEVFDIVATGNVISSAGVAPPTAVPGDVAEAVPGGLPAAAQGSTGSLHLGGSLFGGAGSGDLCVFLSEASWRSGLLASLQPA